MPPLDDTQVQRGLLLPYLKYLLLGASCTLVGVLGYLWLALLSPFTYSPPDGLPDIEQAEHRVFVYGTLRYRPVRWLVYGRSGDPVPASLKGYRREALDIVEAPGERVDGLLLEVDADELARLDRYERLGIRYERVLMTLDDGEKAWVYRRIGE